MSVGPRLRAGVTVISALSIALGIGTAGVALGGGAGSSARGAVLPNGATPVLSVRRLPTVLRTSIGGEALQRDVDAILARDTVGPAIDRSCVLVAVSGRDVAAHRAAAPVIPASTLKLLTATAALSTMAPATTFRTQVRATAPITAGTLQGDLWLVGGGDPLLESKAYTATKRHPPGTATSLDELADRVAATGLRSITGRVIGDDRLFDDVRVVPTWKRSYVSDGEVGPLGGLIVDDNFTDLDAQGRRHAADNVPADAAAAFARLLSDRGIDVGGAAGSADRTAPAAATAAPVEVAAIESLPVGDVVAEMLRESDNTTAEALLKLVGVASGGDGSTAAGVAALRRSLRLAGEPADEVAALKMNDGSGLDRGDRATCRLLLGAVADQPDDGALIAGLAVMGQTGTLRERLKGTDAAGKVRGKTGTLNGVSALVGVTKATDGRRIAFAVVFNGLRSTASGVSGGDALASALVAFPRAPDAASLAPVGATS